MMNKKYYGVYGRNGAGVYTDWSKVCVSKPYFQGFKAKRFSTKAAAVGFIVDGLSREYAVLSREHVNEQMFYSTQNWKFSLAEIGGICYRYPLAYAALKYH